MQKGFIGIQLGGAFVAALAELTRFDDDHGHGHVDAGHHNAVDHVLRLTGGKQFARLAACRIQERQFHRRGSARYAIDGGVTLIADLAPRGLHLGHDKCTGIEVANAHRGTVTGRLDQPLLDGERADGAEHIAAVGRGVDPTLGDHDLDEQVIDIRLGVQRWADDCHFAGLRAAAADTVDLQLVARSHQIEQQLVTFHDGGRQIPSEKHRAFGGTTAHEHTRNSLHEH
ncbi:hypothetical protein SRABI112_03891 [Pseudomonas mediterranea]|nr:hypothetical protein SRABI112_03891 [Pseudomonas mediterranea]